MEKERGRLRRLSLVVLLMPLVSTLSCQRIEVGKLYALQASQNADNRSWEAAVPLVMQAGGGFVNGRNERLANLERDTDPIHAGSASCHHGPPITDVVFIEARAHFTDSEIHLEVVWEDPTADREPRSWSNTPEGWRLEEYDEDAVAILWSRIAGPFGCQEACHMSDFALRQGELIDLRSMRMAEKDQWEEAWIWKASRGAQSLLLGVGGFVTAGEGKPYRKLNSAVAADGSLRPEARRAGTFGAGDLPLVDGEGKRLAPSVAETPAYLYAGKDGGGGLSATAERRGERWRVVFSRALDAGEGRQAFYPGEGYRFGLAVFDGNSTDHHIVRDTQILELVVPAPPPSSQGGKEQAGGRPKGEGGGIL